MANNYPAIRPSMSIDNVNGIYVDPRVTFTRAGTRTFFGQEVVKAEENLVLQSQTFDNSSWTKLNATITADAVAAPDGTTTADALFETVTNGVHRAIQSVPAFNTASMYIQGNGRTKARIYVGAAAADAVTFDLTAETATAGANVTGSITDAGGGWYRCVVHSVTNRTSVEVYADDGTGISYAGDITKGLYVWGAQAEKRSFATAYTPTTTQPITRYQRLLETAAANEWPREFDPVTGEGLGRSVWEARTNLLLRSEEFDNAYWTKSNATVSANQVIAPDGTLTADKLVENTANSPHFVERSITLSTAAHSFSVFAKKGERNFLVLRGVAAGALNVLAWFNLGTGAVGTLSAAGSGATRSITSVGNGWYLCTLVIPSAVASAFEYRYHVSNADNVTTYTGDGYSGIYIWGAMLESGAFATPYTPTVAAQVTRLADSAVMTGVNFSSWYRQDEGAFVVEATKYPIDSIVRPYFDASDGSAANRIDMRRQNATQIWAIITTGGAQQTGGAFEYNFAAGENENVTLSYKTNDAAMCISGGVVASDSTVIIPRVSQLNIGMFGTGIQRLNSHIKRLTYYPQALTSANLQAITR
jgi:hypothetical protein